MLSVCSVDSQIIKYEQRSYTSSKHADRCGPVQEKEQQHHLCYICPHGSHGWSSGWKRDLRAVMLLHKHPESNDNATETHKGKQEQRQQQCYCCYICQHYDKPKHPRKACCMAVSYIYFDKPVGRKVNFFVELVQTHYYIWKSTVLFNTLSYVQEFAIFGVDAKKPNVIKNIHATYVQANCTTCNLIAGKTQKKRGQYRVKCLIATFYHSKERLKFLVHSCLQCTLVTLEGSIACRKKCRFSINIKNYLAWCHKIILKDPTCMVPQVHFKSVWFWNCWPLVL